MRVMPASGVDTALRPGKNLVTRRERAPYREKLSSVRRTQESGSREMRQSWDNTLPPRCRPMEYQKMSLSSAAQTPTPMQRNKFIFPTPATAPAVTSNGALGSGSPIVSARTQTKSTAYPCCIRNGITFSMVSAPWRDDAQMSSNFFLNYQLKYAVYTAYHKCGLPYKRKRLLSFSIS